MAMTPLPSPPSRQDPDTFVARGDALLGALPAFVTEANELQLDVEAAAAIAEAAAAVKNTDQYKGVYSAGTTYTVGQSVKYGGSYWLANKTNLGITPTEGADWSNTVGSNALPLTVESGNVTFASAPNNGKAYVALAMGSQYELVLVHGASSLHAVVWDKTAKVYGSPALIRTAALSADTNVKAVALSATQAVVCSCPTTTAFEAVCLTISGTTITVGTAATETLAGNLVGLNDIQLIGTSVVVGYQRATSVAGIRALSVSGSTVTIGAESALSGTSTAYLHVVSSSVVLTVSTNGTNVYAKPYTASGSTLTAGTEASTAGSLIVNTAVLTTGRWFVTYTNTTGYAAIISVSGTTATLSAVSVLSAAIGSAWPVTGGKVLCVNGSNANVLTDSAGTAVAGTAVAVSGNSIGTSGTTVGYTNTAIYGVGYGVAEKLTYNGNNPLLTSLGGSLTPTVTGNGTDAKCNLARALTNGTAGASAAFSGATSVALCSDASGVSVMSVPQGVTHAYGFVSRAIGYGATTAFAIATATTYKLIRMELAA